MSEDSDRDKELRYKTWDWHRKEGIFMNEHIAQSGYKVVNTSLIINGGASIVLVNSLANIVFNKTNKNSELIDLLSSSLLLFSIGVLLAAIAAGGTYICNYLYLFSHEKQIYQNDHPYIKETIVSKEIETIGIVVHVISAVIVFASFVLFAIGSLKATGFNSL